jgi:hypothetical protein
MTPLLPSVSEHDFAPPLVPDAVGTIAAELKSLLLRRVNLNNDIARTRKLLRSLIQNDNCHRPGAKSHKALWSAKPTSSQNPRRLVGRRAARRSQTNTRSKRPKRWELERACRIALVEAGEPVSVEALYDRTVRRGSVTFADYRRPFRAIVRALNALVKRGEASLLNDGGRRSWRWEIERAPLEQPTFSPPSETHDTLPGQLPMLSRRLV